MDPYPTNTGSTYQDINNINKIILNQPSNNNINNNNNNDNNNKVDIQRQGSASSAITEKRDGASIAAEI